VPDALPSLALAATLFAAAAGPGQHGTPDAGKATAEGTSHSDSKVTADGGSGDGGPSDAGAPEPQATPSSLSGTALGDELRRSAQARQTERQKLEDERKALTAEREKLEKLAAELAAAREELRVETQKLQEASRASAANGSQGGAAAGARAVANIGKQQLEDLASAVKSMKPDQAASLISRLDRPLAVALLQKMKPNAVAKVMENLRPDVAADLLSGMAVAPPKPGDK
jgi:flagellar motility protein MotE (MotC chaperone)